MIDQFSTRSRMRAIRCMYYQVYRIRNYIVFNDIIWSPYGNIRLNKQLYVKKIVNFLKQPIYIRNTCYCISLFSFNLFNFIAWHHLLLFRRL